MTTTINKTQHTINRATEVAIASPQVIAHRVSKFNQGLLNPQTQDYSELNRMWSEKLLGFQESFMAMGFASLSAGATLAQNWNRACNTPLGEHGVFSSSFNSRYQTAAIDVLEAGIDPIHRLATNNAQRLSSDDEN